MAFCTLHHFSKALGKMTSMNIILPETIVGRVPVYYLLHGLSDDYTAWHRRSAIERHAAPYPLIVVLLALITKHGELFLITTPSPRTMVSFLSIVKASAYVPGVTRTTPPSGAKSMAS